MCSHKATQNKVTVFALVLILLAGCSINNPSPTNNDSSSSAPSKTIKVGVVFDLGNDIGLDGLHGIQLLADDVNKNGGLSVGGEKYKVEIISYDSQMTQEGEAAAVNKLVFQDQAKYILSMGVFMGSWINTTEQNKVITMTMQPNPLLSMDPKLHYNFMPIFQNAERIAKVGWFVKNYPDKVKNLVMVYQDNQFGHASAGDTSAAFKAFGISSKEIFVPENMNDMSAMATKVKSLKPTAVSLAFMDTNTLAMGYKALYDAGYKGQFFAINNTSVNSWLQAASPEVFEGMITGMNATETDPAQTKAAQHFKELWISKYGKWNGPSIPAAAMYSCLQTVLEKAGSLDTDKVADVLNNGMEYSTVIGDGKMINRPDRGVNRTVDSVADHYMLRINNGKAEPLASITTDEALGYFRKALPPLAPGEKPPAVPGAPK